MARRNHKSKPIGVIMGMLAGLLVAGWLGRPTLTLGTGAGANGVPASQFLVWLFVGVIMGALLGAIVQRLIQEF